MLRRRSNSGVSLTAPVCTASFLNGPGSEIRLYGDGGPAYGAYSLKVDGGEPTIHTEHSLAQPVGRDLLMHTLTGLTEGRHELEITSLGSRDGLPFTEGEELMFDYAVVTQKVGEAPG
jgi:hypothetical protein